METEPGSFGEVEALYIEGRRLDETHATERERTEAIDTLEKF